MDVSSDLDFIVQSFGKRSVFALYCLIFLCTNSRNQRIIPLKATRLPQKSNGNSPRKSRFVRGPLIRARGVTLHKFGQGCSFEDNFSLPQKITGFTFQAQKITVPLVPKTNVILVLQLDE